MDTERALLAGLARDLDGSFEALVLAHQDRLYSIALRFIGDAHEAEEAAQDALVRAYRALAGYDAARIGALRLRPWLATIVLNLCRNRVTRGHRAQPRPLSLDVDRPGAALPEPVADPSATPAGALDRREAGRRWAELVRELPAVYRGPVVLRHVDGLSYPDIALALDRPEGTVKAQVHRGLALLRNAYLAAEQHEREEVMSA
jgi:RNA polymerase sigma-70 factor (ECF subfamily)